MMFNKRAQLRKIWTIVNQHPCLPVSSSYMLTDLLCHKTPSCLQGPLCGHLCIPTTFKALALDTASAPKYCPSPMQRSRAAGPSSILHILNSRYNEETNVELLWSVQMVVAFEQR